MQKIKRSGGLLQQICDAPDGRGGLWSVNGTIVFSPQPYGPLYRVSAPGGSSAALTKVEKAEASHRWPFFLPDGNHFVFTAQDPYGIFVASLDAPQAKQLNSESSNAIFLKPGLLLFAREGTLVAQPFDAKKLIFTGEGEPLVQERIHHDPNRSIATFSASQGNSLAYQPQVLTIARPTVFDRSGNRCRFLVRRHRTLQLPFFLRLSRITVGANPNGVATWVADQSRLLYTLGNKVCQRQANISSPEELLYESSQYVIVTSGSPDGKLVLMNYQNPRGDWDIWTLSLSGDRKAQKLIETLTNEAGAQFSPDEKWLAFGSDSTGQMEIYVAPFSDPNRQLQISTDGGQGVRWTSNGKELMQVNNEKVMSVEVKAEGSLGNPKLLFERPPASLNQPVAINPEGERIVLLMPTGDQPADNIHLITNWSQLLKSEYFQHK